MKRPVKGIGKFNAIIKTGGFWYTDLVGEIFELKWDKTRNPNLIDTPFNRSQLERLRSKSDRLDHVMRSGTKDPIGYGVLDIHIEVVAPEDNHEALQVLYKEDWL